jgi:hypothetical protein
MAIQSSGWSYAAHMFGAELKNGREKKSVEGFAFGKGL